MMLAMRAFSFCCLLAIALAACSADKPDPTTGGGSPASDKTQKPAAPHVAENADAYLAHLKKIAAQAESDGKTTLPGTGKDVLLVKELRSLAAGTFWGDAAQTASRAAKANRRDPLPAIVAYHEALKKAGIEWVFVPVPAKVAVDPSLVPGAPAVEGRIDVHCIAFYDELRKAGVPVLDVVPDLQELVSKGTRAHCMTDTHWTPAACETVAALVRERAAKQRWFAQATKTEFETTPKTLTLTGDMAAMRREATGPEQLASSVVEGTTTSDSSPVLLLGDSHCLVFHQGGDMHAKGAGFPDHVAQQLSMPITVVGVRGSGATPSRVDAFRGKRFEGKKFAIWCLTAREFTEGQGWSTIPVKR
jgi:hypothetical protein